MESYIYLLLILSFIWTILSFPIFVLFVVLAIWSQFEKKQHDKKIRELYKLDKESEE